MSKLQRIDSRISKLSLNENKTDTEVDLVWNAFKHQYKTKTIRKKDSKLMSIVGTIFEKLNICTKENFMSNITTTVGRTIYLSNNYSGYSNIYKLELAIHEHMHVDNGVGVSYITSKNKRAKEEARVYITTNLLLYGNRRNNYIHFITPHPDSKIYQTSKYDSEYTLKKAQIAWKLWQNGITNEPYVNEVVDLLADVLL